MTYYYVSSRYPDYLCHHGILGMKWGIRRYQNKDGTLTDAGKKRLVKRLVKDDARRNNLKFNRRVNSAIGDGYRKSSTSYKDALEAKNKYEQARGEARNKANEAATKAIAGDSFQNALFRGDMAKVKTYMEAGNKTMREITSTKKYQKLVSDAYESLRRAERESREYVNKTLGDYGKTPLKNPLSIKYDLKTGKVSQQTVADKASIELIREIMRRF